jgi:hypothetical protein
MSNYETESEGFYMAFYYFIKEESARDTPLIQVYADSISWNSLTNPDDLRTTEKETVYIDDGNYLAVFDIRKTSQMTAGFGIGTTLFVCFVLASGAMLFTKETQDLVITPIETMIIKVNRISMNPLLAA